MTLELLEPEEVYSALFRGKIVVDMTIARIYFLDVRDRCIRCVVPRMPRKDGTFQTAHLLDVLKSKRKDGISIRDLLGNRMVVAEKLRDAYALIRVDEHVEIPFSVIQENLDMLQKNS